MSRLTREDAPRIKNPDWRIQFNVIPRPWWNTRLWQWPIISSAKWDLPGIKIGNFMSKEPSDLMSRSPTRRMPLESTNKFNFRSESLQGSEFYLNDWNNDANDSFWLKAIFALNKSSEKELISKNTKPKKDNSYGANQTIERREFWEASVIELGFNVLW